MPNEPTKNDTILQRARARQDGRYVAPPRTARRSARAPVVKPNLKDPLRDAVKAGDVTIDDFEISTRQDPDFRQYPATEWTEAGPSDVNAALAFEQGHEVHDLASVRKSEKTNREDEREYRRAVAAMNRAARERRDEVPQEVQPLPSAGHELSSKTEGDLRKFDALQPGSEEHARALFGDLSTLAPAAAQVGHDLPPNAGDQGATVTYTPPPEG